MDEGCRVRAADQIGGLVSLRICAGGATGLGKLVLIRPSSRIGRGGKGAWGQQDGQERARAAREA